MNAPVLEITRHGQPFVDEPVYVTVSKARPVSLAVNRALASLRPQDSTAPQGPRIEPVIQHLSHYDRVRLKWMRPDGNGGFVPRDSRR